MVGTAKTAGEDAQRTAGETPALPVLGYLDSSK